MSMRVWLAPDVHDIHHWHLKKSATDWLSCFIKKKLVCVDVFAAPLQVQIVSSSSPLVAAASIIYKCEYFMMTSGQGHWERAALMSRGICSFGLKTRPVMAPPWRHKGRTRGSCKIRVGTLFWVKLLQEKSEENNKNVSQSCSMQISKCTIFLEAVPREKKPEAHWN